MKDHSRLAIILAVIVLITIPLSLNIYFAHNKNDTASNTPCVQPESTTEPAIAVEYHILDIKGNWFEANSHCRSKGMQLIEVSTKGKNDDVLKAIRAKGYESESFWTMGTKLGASSFHWFNTYEKLRFENWAPGEPNKNNVQNEDCMEINSSQNLQWNNAPCYTTKHIMCERLERPKPITNDKYYFALSKMNWYRGISYCNSIGMKLIDVSTKEKNDEIVELINENFNAKKSFWTSGNTLQSYQWNWFETDKKFNFTNWAFEPNSWNVWLLHQNCISLWNEQRWNWNYNVCDEEFRIICEQSV